MSDGNDDMDATWQYRGIWPIKAQKIQRAITFDLELCFEKTYSRWKSLREKKMMTSFLNGF
jgi:hypothetical protein